MHTQGPWQTEFNECGGYDCMTGAWLIHAANKISIAEVDQGSYGQGHCDYSFRSAEAEANARLIAAAPDLYRELKALLERHGGPESAYKAIAKVEHHG